MKIYSANQTLPVNSAERRLPEAVIPAWAISGNADNILLGEWSPSETILLQSCRVIALEAEASAVCGLAILKHNLFVNNITVASVAMTTAGGLQYSMSMAEALTSATLVTPMDRLQCVSLHPNPSDGFFKDVTIQLAGKYIL